MNLEQDYIIKSFRENFLELKDKRIAIYGIGPNTKLILDHFPEYHIEALLDSTTIGENIWGKEVINHLELKEYEVDAVIIVARYCNVKIIYQRISEYCTDNKIPIYDINGNAQGEESNESFEEQSSISKDELIKEIDSYDIVSFDIFDTLIMRKVLYPTDVFEAVEIKAKEKGYQEIDFAKIRVKAEQICNSKMVPGINEIYNEIHLLRNIDCNILEQYKNLEIEMELQFVISRQEMVDVVKNVYLRNKKVIFVSDMYLPCKTIERMLHKHGITSYTSIFVSCEYGKTKGNGLFDIAYSGYDRKNIIHIGDNYEIDYIMAKQYGINAVHIDSAIEMLQKSPARDTLQHINNSTFASRYMLGLYIAKSFCNPFLFSKTGGKLEVAEEEKFGYMFLGPIMTQYILWMDEKICKHNSLILFTSRDGYLLKKIYSIFVNRFKNKKFAKAVYFLTSRICSAAAGLKNEEDILSAYGMPFSGKTQEMLEKRFFLTKDEILPRNIESNQEYLLRHKSVIIKRSEELRNSRKKYYDSVFNKEEEIYWIDFVSSGTGQYYLEYELGHKLKGLYFNRFITHDKKKNQLDIDSLYSEGCAYSDEQWLIKYYIFIETIMTSEESTLLKFDCDGNPVFLEERRTTDEILSIEKVHNGIIDFFKDYIEFCSIKCNSLDIPDILLGTMRPECNNIVLNLGDNAHLEDEFANRKFSGMNMSWKG